MKVICPNILASIHAQFKLNEVFGYEILSIDKKPHETQCFIVIFPPCGCCSRPGNCNQSCNGCEVAKHNDWTCPLHKKKDKPVILKDDCKGKIEEYVDLFDALGFFRLVERGFNINQEKKI